MSLFQKTFRIESTRLPAWDYSNNGYYFITTCAHRREHLFGKVTDKRMVLNGYGRIVESCWRDIARHYTGVILDCHVTMPDHFHGLIQLVDVRRADADVNADVEMGLRPISTTNHVTSTSIVEPPSIVVPPPTVVPSRPTKPALPEIVRAFKSFSARMINMFRGTPGAPVWQPGYYDMILWDEHAVECVRRYISINPSNWRRRINTR